MYVKITGCVFVAPSVRFSQSIYNVNEDDQSVQLVLVLNDQAPTDIVVTVSSTDISAKGKDITTLYIKTHGSELRGQEEAGRMHATNE